MPDLPILLYEDSKYIHCWTLFEFIVYNYRRSAGLDRVVYKSTRYEEGVRVLLLLDLQFLGAQ